MGGFAGLAVCLAPCGALLQAQQLGLLLPGQPLSVLVCPAVGEGEGPGDAHVDADLRPLVGLRLGFQGLDAEGNVPAERVLDQPRTSDPVALVGALANGEVFGPAEADTAGLRQVGQAPPAVDADDVRPPGL